MKVQVELELSHLYFNGGDEQNRTVDPLLARQVLSQLSYAPIFSLKKVVGTGGLEPPTSRLSGVRSNHLSYAPSFPSFPKSTKGPSKLNNDT